MICVPPQGTPPHTHQPTWPTAHTAHCQHCGHTTLPPGRAEDKPQRRRAEGRARTGGRPQWNICFPQRSIICMYVCMQSFGAALTHARTRAHGPTAPRHSQSSVAVCICKDLAAPAHTRTRAHRPAAPRQSSGVSQTPHPTACPQSGIPHRPPHRWP